MQRLRVNDRVIHPDRTNEKAQGWPLLFGLQAQSVAASIGDIDDRIAWRAPKYYRIKRLVVCVYKSITRH